MSLPNPEPGLIICYSYLWCSEYEQGREEGVKDRPCAIVLTTQDEEDDTIVTVVPITHVPPDQSKQAIEIPLPTKRRLGLDSERSWVLLTEINRFVWPGPDLRSISKKQPERFDYGFLPPSLFEKIKQGIRAQNSAKKLKKVLRSD